MSNGGVNENTWDWNIRWRRVLYEWENDEMRRLKHTIEQKGPSRERQDGVY